MQQSLAEVSSWLHVAYRTEKHTSIPSSLADRCRASSLYSRGRCQLLHVDGCADCVSSAVRGCWHGEWQGAEFSLSEVFTSAIFLSITHLVGLLFVAGVEMPKHDFMSPKAISNRIKSKGLQKLRWFCQMCEKQCRDEVR